MKSFKQFVAEQRIFEADLSKFIDKRTNPSTGKEEWAFIDIHKPDKVFKYFGTEKPSDEEIRKELGDVEYFKNNG